MKDSPKKRFRNESVYIAIAVAVLLLLAISPVIFVKNMAATKLNAKQTPTAMATNQLAPTVSTGKTTVEFNFRPSIKKQ